MVTTGKTQEALAVAASDPSTRALHTPKPGGRWRGTRGRAARAGRAGAAAAPGPGTRSLSPGSSAPSATARGNARVGDGRDGCDGRARAGRTDARAPLPGDRRGRLGRVPAVDGSVTVADMASSVPADLEPALQRGKHSVTWPHLLLLLSFFLGEPTLG